jgi:hypothetical protein
VRVRQLKFGASPRPYLARNRVNTLTVDNKHFLKVITAREHLCTNLSHIYITLMNETFFNQAGLLHISYQVVASLLSYNQLPTCLLRRIRVLFPTRLLNISFQTSAYIYSQVITHFLLYYKFPAFLLSILSDFILVLLRRLLQIFYHAT